MTIKINIIKTADGYNFRNTESGKLVGTVHKGRNKQGIYVWETFEAYGFNTLNKCLNFLKLELTTRAEQLGCDIEFIDIDNNK